MLEANETLKTIEDFADFQAGPKNKLNHPSSAGDFTLTESGLFHKDTRSDGAPYKICSPIEVIAQTRSERGDNWGRLLKFKDNDGVEKTWAMPMALLSGDGQTVWEQLMDMGLQISPGREPRKLLNMYLQTSATEKRVRSVRRVGWHDNSFVFPDSSIGGSESDAMTLQGSGDSVNKFKISGTLEEWKERIGRPCIGNSRLIFGVSAAFAAPLLELLAEESGGFHFMGMSSIGKTTLLSVAGSVYGGGGPRGFVESWRATSNGLEAVATSHCDCLLVLDELAQVDARDAGECAYLLSNGTGKNRAARSGGARQKDTWRILFLSSGEIGLSQHMLQAGKHVRAGQEVRMLELPADAGKNMGLFENIHSFSSGAEISKHLVESSHQYYGTPIRKFLKLLTDKKMESSGHLREMRDVFLGAVVPKGASGQVVRAAGRFALVAAAGEFVAHHKVVPWEDGEATKAVKVLFNAWLAQRGGHLNLEVPQVVSNVRSFLQENGTARFPKFGGVDSIELFDDKALRRAGFRKDKPLRGCEWMIFPDVFKKEVCKGYDSKMVAQVLKDKGFLRTGNDGKNSRSEHLPGGLGKTRVYCIDSSIMEEESGNIGVPGVPNPYSENNNTDFWGNS